MDIGKAIFYVMTLIALAVFATDAMHPASAGIMGSGRYMGVGTKNPLVINIVDTETGAARYCQLVGSLAGSEAGCQAWVIK